MTGFISAAPNLAHQQTSRVKARPRSQELLEEQGELESKGLGAARGEASSPQAEGAPAWRKRGSSHVWGASPTGLVPTLILPLGTLQEQDF